MSSDYLKTELIRIAKAARQEGLVVSNLVT